VERFEGDLDVGGLGRTFGNRFKWVVGNGREVFFWKDNWVGFSDLKSRFPRLFSLSVVKDAKLFRCGDWVNNIWVWNLIWRSGLFEWEENQVSQLLEEVHGLSLVMEKENKWVWNDDESIEYSVNFAYSFLRGAEEGLAKRLYSSFWMIKALPSAHVTAWRVLENKLATKVNLERHEVELESILCYLCGVNELTTNHLFFGCRID